MSFKCKECYIDINIDHAQVGGVHMTCEYNFFYNKTESMIRLRPMSGGSWCVVSPEAADDIIKDSEEKYEVELVMYSKGEIENMPEHTGW
jgi:hypothetical protein